jgi:hypothetical protein
MFFNRYKKKNRTYLKKYIQFSSNIQNITMLHCSKVLKKKYISQNKFNLNKQVLKIYPSQWNF